MAFILRRVFFGKVGMAEPLVNHHKEAEKLFQQYGASLKRRVLTDYQSGRSDRVVVEWEVNDLSEFEGVLGKVRSNPEGEQAFKAWEDRLKDMIHYTEVETWVVR